MDFDSIYARYKEMVFNYVFWKVNDYDDAVDLTQEIFIKIYKGLNKFKGEASIKTWVMSIAVNHVIDFLKKRNNQKMLYFEEANDGDEEDGSDNFEPSEEMQVEDEIKLEKALEKLKDWEREIIVLYYMEGFQYSELAELLKIPIGTVKSRLNAAKRHLKLILTGVENG